MPPALIEPHMRDSEDEEQCQKDDIAALSVDGQSKQTDCNACARSRPTRAPAVRTLSVTIGTVYMYQFARRG
jgi:hypothetical protein